jgi:hypothetical protein
MPKQKNAAPKASRYGVLIANTIYVPGQSNPVTTLYHNFKDLTSFAIIISMLSAPLLIVSGN